MLQSNELIEHFVAEQSISSSPPEQLLIKCADLSQLTISQWRQVLTTFRAKLKLNTDSADDESRVDSSRWETPELKPLDMYCSNSAVLAKFSGKTVKQSRSDLQFIAIDNCDSRQAVTSKEKNITVLLRGQGSTASDFTFNFEAYNNLLKTKNIGRLVIHGQTVNSSFDIVEGNFLHNGLVVVVDRQMAGQGRYGNKWLSPTGCAMFSLQLDFDLGGRSRVAEKLSFLQHLIALSAVHNLNTAFPSLDLKLKWPNDVYSAGGVKVGGVIVRSSVFKAKIQINVGMGLNLNNQEPTISVNSLIKTKLGKKGASREQYLAGTFNNLENFVNQIESGHMEVILDLYHKYWMHSDQQVTLKDDKGARTKGVVKSLDDDGYLSVELDDGRLVSVQPDGNSFDMMQGLIVPKFSKQ